MQLLIHLSTSHGVCRLDVRSLRLEEGLEGVKRELGFAHFRTGKMGFTALGLGFGDWDWERSSV